ncbi:MAG: hypothetical protein R2697_12005 [Ilumatobacteraceae bacterium]
MLEIATVDDAIGWAARPEPRPPAAFRAIDLRDAPGFEHGTFDRCVFLSCLLTPAQAGFLTATGATIVRDRPERPYTLHRNRLYSPEELFAGFDPSEPDGYAETFDARVYRHWERTGRQHPPFIDESLARRLHDHSITEALNDELVGRRPVAIMGGHGLERSSPGYLAIAEIARTLTRDGYTMLSGGGPGAMEATHLGVDGPLPRRRTRRRDRGARASTSGCRAGQGVRRPRLAASRLRRPRALARSRTEVRLDRHPDVDVRARATGRVRDEDREVLREQCARRGVVGRRDVRRVVHYAGRPERSRRSSRRRPRTTTRATASRRRWC